MRVKIVKKYVACLINKLLVLTTLLLPAGISFAATENFTPYVYTRVSYVSNLFRVANDAEAALLGITDTDDRVQYAGTGFRADLPVSRQRLRLDVAVDKVTAALKTQGFGVLTKIDVKATLKEKINKDFRPYAILGACNPSLAHRALENEPLIGLLLPCNVTVESTETGTLVSIVNPETMLSVGILAQNDIICDVATEAGILLKKVAESLTHP